MAAVANARTTLGRDLTGINLTDGTYQSLVAGDSNGSEFTFGENDILILRNDTGGDAIYKFWPEALPGAFTTFGVTATNPTKTVATGKIWAIRISDFFKDAATLKVLITCDVAGKLMVINPT